MMYVQCGDPLPEILQASCAVPAYWPDVCHSHLTEPHLSPAHTANIKDNIVTICPHNSATQHYIKGSIQKAIVAKCLSTSLAVIKQGICPTKNYRNIYISFYIS